MTNTNPLIDRTVVCEGVTYYTVEDTVFCKLYINVTSMCYSIGIPKFQIVNQTGFIEANPALKNGCKKFSSSQYQNALFIDVLYIQKWFSEIPITSSMKRDNPTLIQNIEYLKSKPNLVEEIIELVKPTSNILPSKPDLEIFDLPEKASDSNLLQKLVDFEGNQILTIQDTRTGIIYGGIKSICRNIGLSEGQYSTQLKLIIDDDVLKESYSKFAITYNSSKKETSFIEAKMIPYWIAKINITPTIKTENPTLAGKLKAYQFKASDVLAAAFMPQLVAPIFTPPTNFLELAKLWVVSLEENEKLIKEKEFLLEENQDLTEKVEIMVPIMDQWQVFLNSKETRSMREFAMLVRAVDHRGKVLGQNLMFKFLRSIGVLDAYNQPYQQHVTSEYFATKEIFGNGRIHFQTRLTRRGMSWVYDLLVQSGHTISIGEGIGSPAPPLTKNTLPLPTVKGSISTAVN